MQNKNKKSKTQKKPTEKVKVMVSPFKTLSTSTLVIEVVAEVIVKEVSWYVGVLSLSDTLRHINALDLAA